MGWLTGWSNRIPITVSAADVQSSLSGFPLMIKLSAAAGKNNSNIIQALPTLFEMRDVPGVSLKENKYYTAYNPNTQFSKPTATSVQVSINARGGGYMFFSVRRELLIPGTQIEYNWEVTSTASNVNWRVFARDDQFERYNGCFYPYEDVQAPAGAGNLQTIEEFLGVDNPGLHTTKETLNINAGQKDWVTFVWYAVNGWSKNATYNVNWIRFLDADDTVLFNVDLSGSLTNELTGTYQDYAKVGDPDSDNSNIGKIALTSSDGETQLPIEIESWNFENEEIILWTKTALSNSTDTTLYLYYDANQEENIDYVRTPIVASTADLVDDDCSSLSGWADDDNNDGVSRLTPEGNTFEFHSGFWPSSGDRARRIKTLSYATHEVIELRLNHRRLGLRGDADHFQSVFRNDYGVFNLVIDTAGLYFYNDAWIQVYSRNINTGEWYSWVFDVDIPGPSASGTVDVYLNGHKVLADQEIYQELGAATPGEVAFSQYGYTTTGMRTNIDYIKIGSDIVKRSVWDDNYVGVWHMDKYPSVVKESAHALDLVPANMGYSNTVTGTLGRAFKFNGSDERLYSAGDNLRYHWLDVADLTASVFFSTDSDTTGTMVGRYDSSANNKRIWALRKRPTYQLSVDIGNSDGTNGATQALTGVNTISGGGWKQAAFTFSSGTGVESVYINGQSVSFTGNQTYTSLNTSDNDKTLEVGARNDGGSDFYDGDIDEVRISSTVRSDAWMNAEYNSCIDNFITYGPLEGTPKSSPDTVAAIYDNPIYNVSTSGIEVYNVDISTEYYVAYATLSGVNCVTESKAKLLIGTTTNGILYIPTSTISGTNIYAPQNFTSQLLTWKQEPNITNNHVKDLSACGDYVCVVTVSGVDHFNLGNSHSYDHSIGLTAAASSCSNANLMVEDMEDITDWTDNSVGGNISETPAGRMRLQSGSTSGNFAQADKTNIHPSENRVSLEFRIYVNDMPPAPVEGVSGGMCRQGLWTDYDSGQTFLPLIANNQFYYWNGSNYVAMSGSPTINADTWYTIMYDMDWTAGSNGVADVYVNGAYQGQMNGYNGSTGNDGRVQFLCQTWDAAQYECSIEWCNVGDNITTSCPPGKCFQTCRGRFYYTAGTKIVTIYTHQCDWTEGTIGYEYDSTASGTLLPTESEINDIHVVENVGRPNLIFVATTSGVALIEEKPGDELNAQYKHYFVED
jgi:hypothetical protein